MKHCAREADCGARARETAQRALAVDCRQELSDTFLTRLRVATRDRQGSLFPQRLADSLAARLTTDGASVLEQQVVSHLARREACGQTGRQAAVGALADAMSARKESQFRAMQGHWLKEAGAKQAAPAIRAAREALHNIASDRLAVALLDDGTSKSIRYSRPPLDLDCDLRA
jgi:hypothetical protein